MALRLHPQAAGFGIELLQSTCNILPPPARKEHANKDPPPPARGIHCLFKWKHTSQDVYFGGTTGQGRESTELAHNGGRPSLTSEVVGRLSAP
jgi:hypothetical protein